MSNDSEEEALYEAMVREQIMSGDYKDEIQSLFEALVALEFGCNYWDLPQDEQYRLYMQASREYADRMADRADYLRKAERENPR